MVGFSFIWLLITKQMKTNNHFIFIICSFTILCFSFFVSSCNHPEEDSTSTSTTGGTDTPKGDLYFHLHTYIDNNEVDLYNTNYTADDGRKMSLQLAQLYISEIQLVKLDGSLVNIPNKHILMEREIATYKIGNVPVGNYKSVRFKIGLDPTTNSLNPSQSNDSAILNRPEMWFDAAPQPSSYVFVAVKGKIDTSENADNTSAQMQPFEYKIGTNQHYTQINMPDKNYSVYQNQISYLHVIVDYYKLLNGITLNNPTNLSATTVEDNNHAPATTFANNISLLFRFEE
jgi:hypothetical protein